MSAREEFEYYAPDATDAERLLGTMRASRVAPERRLQLAVLEQALDDLKSVGAARADAIAWCLRDTAGPFTFHGVCEALDIDPGSARLALGVRALEPEAKTGDWEPKNPGPRPKRGPAPPRGCRGCGARFNPRKPQSRYCSARCGMRVGKRRSRERGQRRYL